MKKFMVLYHAPTSAMEQMKSADPEQMKAGMEQWAVWAQKVGDHLLEMGTPLGGGMTISKSDSGPSNKDVAGYSVMQAENIEQVMDLLKDHPHLQWMDEATIEVHESLPMPE